MPVEEGIPWTRKKFFLKLLSDNIYFPLNENDGGWEEGLGESEEGLRKLLRGMGGAH